MPNQVKAEVPSELVAKNNLNAPSNCLKVVSAMIADAWEKIETSKLVVEASNVVDPIMTSPRIRTKNMKRQCSMLKITKMTNDQMRLLIGLILIQIRLLWSRGALGRSVRWSSSLMCQAVVFSSCDVGVCGVFGKEYSE
jgi:hypothetical protein